jgi:hypothetical protein
VPKPQACQGRHKAIGVKRTNQVTPR